MEGPVRSAGANPVRVKEVLDRREQQNSAPSERCAIQLETTRRVCRGALDRVRARGVVPPRGYGHPLARCRSSIGTPVLPGERRGGALGVRNGDEETAG